MKKKTQKPAEKVIITKFNPAEEIMKYMDEIYEISWLRKLKFEEIAGNLIDDLCDKLIKLPHAKHIAEALYEATGDDWLNSDEYFAPFNFAYMANEFLSRFRKQKPYISIPELVDTFYALERSANCYWRDGDGGEDYELDLLLTENEIKLMQNEYKTRLAKLKNRVEKEKFLETIKDEFEEYGHYLWTPYRVYESTDSIVHVGINRDLYEIIKNLLTEFNEEQALSIMRHGPDANKWLPFSYYFNYSDYPSKGAGFLRRMFPPTIKVTGKELFEAIGNELMTFFEYYIDSKRKDDFEKLNEYTKNCWLNGREEIEEGE